MAPSTRDRKAAVRRHFVCFLSILIEAFAVRSDERAQFWTQEQNRGGSLIWINIELPIYPIIFISKSKKGNPVWT
jgi:hypothetical protein